MKAHLVPERVQEPDRVDLQDRMHRARLRLQVLEDMVREELDDIHERVRRRDSMLRQPRIISFPHHIPTRPRESTYLRRAPPRRHRRHDIDRRVLRAPILRRVRSVVLQALPDPRPRDLRRLALVPGRDQRAQHLRRGLPPRERVGAHARPAERGHREVEPDVLEWVVFELLDLVFWGCRVRVLGM